MDFVWHFWICVSVLNTCSWTGLLFPVIRTGCEESSRQLFVCRAILIRHLANGPSAVNFRRVCLDIITSVWQASKTTKQQTKERRRKKKTGKKKEFPKHSFSNIFRIFCRSRLCGNIAYFDIGYHLMLQGFSWRISRVPNGRYFWLAVAIFVFKLRVVFAVARSLACCSVVAALSWDTHQAVYSCVKCSHWNVLSWLSLV